MKRLTIVLTTLFMCLMLVPMVTVLAVPATERANRVTTQESTEETVDGVDEVEEESIGSYVREKVKNLKNENAATRVQVKAEITIKVRERLEKMIQNAVQRYEKVKTQVENSDLTEEEKDVILGQLDEQIAKLNLLAAEVEGVTDVAELKAALQKVRTGYKASLGLVRQSIKGVYEDRLTKISEQIEVPYTKISERVETLEEGDLKEELRQQLAEARGYIDSAMESMEAGNLFEAKEYLVSAKEALKQVVLMLKTVEVN
jgi:hypothetical protein